MTKRDVIAKLKSMVRECGSQSALAERLKVHPSDLNYVLKGRRDPTPKILAAIRWKKVISYEPIAG